MTPQGIDAIALSIPVFFALIGLELALDRRERRREGRAVYRANDSINDLACGTLQQLVGLFAKTLLFAGYVVVFEKVAVWSLDPGRWSHWLVAFLGVDFCYYWFHRASHEVNFLWAAHIVHHQSEEYNLSVALRQSAIQQFFSMPFYWPLAALGVPPLMYLACDAADTLYQFWIHTRKIGRLGFLESFLNTPSHHRVHHGSNEKYIDRNHAGTLIVWDKLFGTFQREEEEPAYGVTRPLASWNPLWANVHYYVELVSVARRARRWRDKIRIFFAPPGWRPADVPFEPVAYSPVDGRRYDARPPNGLGLLAFVQFLVAMGAVIALLFAAGRWGRPAEVALALFAVWGLANVGGLCDRRPWLPASETLRWLATAATAGVLAPAGARAAAVAAAGVAGLLAVVPVLARRADFDLPTGSRPPVVTPSGERVQA